MIDILHFIFSVIRGQVVPLVPDSFFWYTISTALFVFALWVGKRFIDSQKEQQDKTGALVSEMGKCLIELTTISKVHEVHIQSLLKKVDDQGDDIETLREFYIVTYKK
jgi:hypothetical protein